MGASPCRSTSCDSQGDFMIMRFSPRFLAGGKNGKRVGRYLDVNLEVCQELLLTSITIEPNYLLNLVLIAPERSSAHCGRIDGAVDLLIDSIDAVSGKNNSCIFLELRLLIYGLMKNIILHRCCSRAPRLGNLEPRRRSWRRCKRSLDSLARS